MAASIEYYTNAYTADVERFIKGVDECAQASSPVPAELQELRARIRDLQGNLKTELRLLDASQKAAWRTKINLAGEGFAEAEKKLVALKQGRDKAALLGTSRARGGGGDDPLEGKTNAEALGMATDLQDQMFAAGENMQRIINDTVGVAAATDAELQSQRQQLETIQGEVNRIDSLLEMSNKLVASVSKRLQTDKVLMCFAVTNTALIIAVIAYAAVSRSGLGGSDDAPQSN